jgi:hypothetical protein
MALTQTATPPERCPRCAGPMYRDYTNEYTCLYCGEHVFGAVPPRPAVKDTPRTAEVRPTPRPRRRRVAAA